MHMIWYKSWKWDMPRGSLQTRQKLQLKKKLCGFKPDICSSSLIGAERKQPGPWYQGASCLNLCQLICHRGLIDQKTQPATQPNGTVICQFISQLAAKTLRHTTSERSGGGRGGRRRVKQNPRLQSLLANTVKSPKVYCLSICWPSQEGSESSLTVWPSCVFMEPGSNLTCFSFSATPAKDASEWYEAGNQHRLSDHGEGCHACHAGAHICLEYLNLIRQCST